MKFVKFTETNDHEGEEWIFFLQVDGNEAELAKMEDMIESWEDESGYDSGYQLGSDDEIPESEVDICVKHSPSGYMDTFNKVVGVFTNPVEDDLDDLFYKGGIRDHFKDVA